MNKDSNCCDDQVFIFQEKIVWGVTRRVPVWVVRGVAGGLDVGLDLPRIISFSNLRLKLFFRFFVKMISYHSGVHMDTDWGRDSARLDIGSSDHSQNAIASFSLEEDRTINANIILCRKQRLYHLYNWSNNLSFSLLFGLWGWSACSPSIPTIRVRILLKLAIFL